MTPQERKEAAKKNVNSERCLEITRQRAIKNNWKWASLGGKAQKGDAARTCLGRHWVTNEVSNRLVYTSIPGFRRGKIKNEK